MQRAVLARDVIQLRDSLNEAQTLLKLHDLEDLFRVFRSIESPLYYTSSLSQQLCKAISLSSTLILDAVEEKIGSVPFSDHYESEYVIDSVDKVKECVKKQDEWIITNIPLSGLLAKSSEFASFFALDFSWLRSLCCLSHDGFFNIENNITLTKQSLHSLLF